MSQHRSLRAAATLGGKRNVLKRFERVELLKKRGQWKEGDRITVEGKPIRAKRKIYVALNKPRGLVCSRKDELKRAAIYELLPKEWGHLHSVGRLDFNSEGLLFLTNDGEFSLHLTHPRYGVRKKYVVTIEEKIAPAVLEGMTRGIYHEGERLRAERARIIKAGPRGSVIELELSEGKNREV